ncbi:MAG TPA: hypothetical protein VF725_05295 [Ktedonobacterales bacterium]
MIRGEAWARNVEDAPSRPARQAAQARLDWWTRRGARAAKRLLASGQQVVQRQQQQVG